MQRPNKRVIILRTGESKHQARQAIDSLPVGQEGFAPLYEVVIQEHVAGMTATQRGYYWLRLGEISTQVKPDGRFFSAEAWAEWFKDNVMPELVELKNGDIVSKRLDLPGGKTAFVSINDLSKNCKADYQTMIEAYAAQEFGVRFSADPKRVMK
jgi:hypothetical protein